MANLLEDILKAAGDEEIDLIVFNNDYYYKDDERYSWIPDRIPFTFDIRREKFNVKYDTGYGGEDFPPFWASTKSGHFILICSCYDGSTAIHRVPTSFQHSFIPQFYGGG